MKTYTLKANSHWNTEGVRRVASQIHIARELPKKISITRDILECWHPTIEEDDGVVAYLTRNYSLWIVIGDNELYANEDSSYLFMGFNNCCTIDGLDLINTQNVQSFDSAFAYCGCNAKMFSIKGIEKWNTSSVRNMWRMFTFTGYYARKWDIGDLSGWDTSNVTDMSFMFCNAGYSATIWNIGILSNWNVANVINMTCMFMRAGYNADSFDIGDLSRWNIANVSYMENMFLSAGHCAKKFILDGLEEWDLSHSTKRPITKKCLLIQEVLMTTGKRNELS